MLCCHKSCIASRDILSDQISLKCPNRFMQVMYDKYTNRSRRFGFVTMSTAEEANASTEALNGTVRSKCSHYGRRKWADFL
jgi:hypothetical protein